MKSISIAVGMMLVASQAVAQDGTTHAMAMCRAIDNMGMASAPCSVSGKTVTATINMNHLEAAKFCGGAREQMRSAGARFEAGWEFKIIRPVTHEIVAICDL